MENQGQDMPQKKQSSASKFLNRAVEKIKSLGGKGRGFRKDDWSIKVVDKPLEKVDANTTKSAEEKEIRERAGEIADKYTQRRNELIAQDPKLARVKNWVKIAEKGGAQFDYAVEDVLVNEADILREKAEKMSVGEQLIVAKKFLTEGNGALYDRDDLTTFENTITGRSHEYEINGKLINITDDNIAELIKDPDIRKVILSAANYREGKRTLDEINKVRLKKKAIKVMSLFEIHKWIELCNKNMLPAFEQGSLDQNGELKEFRIFLLQNDEKIDLPEDIEVTLPLNKGFADILEYLGKEGNSMKFRIKSAEEIKNETAKVSAKL